MNNKYGELLNDNITLHREWFKEMTSLIGINVIYKAPDENAKHYNSRGELQTTYKQGVLVGCIFDEHPNQWTLRKMGWVAELQEDASIIHVPYDLEGLQQGAIFIIPSGIDNAEGRVFRVVRLSNIIIYPASIACEIVPEYADVAEPSQFEYKNNNFTLLREEEEE